MLWFELRICNISVDRLIAPSITGRSLKPNVQWTVPLDMFPKQKERWLSKRIVYDGPLNKELPTWWWKASPKLRCCDLWDLCILRQMVHRPWCFEVNKGRGNSWNKVAPSNCHIKEVHKSCYVIVYMRRSHVALSVSGRKSKYCLWSSSKQL